MSALPSSFTAAWRSLSRAPVLVVITVLSLGVGIGATTTVFSIVNAFAFAPAAGLADPDSLVTICAGKQDGNPHGPLSYLDFLSVGESVDTLDDVAASGFDALALDDGGDRNVQFVQVVTGNFFPLLGIEPVLGRGFLPAESRPGSAARVVIVSNDLWRQNLGGDSSVLGTTLRLGGQPFTVVGVAPKGLRSRVLGLKPAAWIPIGIPGASSRRSVSELDARGVRNFQVMGRLKQGASIQQTQAQLDVLAARLNREFPDSWNDKRGRPLPLVAVSERESRLLPGARGIVTGIASFLFLPAGLALMIACANVGSLFLARAEKRRREMAVRVALGARRRNLISLLFGESLMLGLAGGVVGFVLTHLANRRLSTLTLPLGIPTLHFEFVLDARVLGFALAASLVATLLFGLGPAMRASRLDLTPALKAGGGAGLSHRRARLRSALVVAQFAGALVMVAGMSLFLRSLQHAVELDLGLDPERIALTAKAFDKEASRALVASEVRDVLERLRSQPGVEDAQVGRGVELTLLGAMTGTLTVIPDHGANDDADEVAVDFNAVTPGYIGLLKIPLIRGRSLRETDVTGAPLVAVINESFATHFFPGEDPLGRHFTVPSFPAEETTAPAEGARTFEVVGVTRDAPYWDIDEGAHPYFWASLWQAPSRRVAFLVKGRDSAAAMIPMLAREVAIGDRELSLQVPTPLASLVDLQFLALSVPAKILGYGGAFGLFLAIIGIYGIVAFTVAMRSREIAIRIAVGAKRSDVLKMFLRRGIGLGLVGLALGMMVVVPLAHLVKTLLIGMSPLDPIALGGSAAAIILAAALGSVLPAARATRIEPMNILREE